MKAHLLNWMIGPAFLGALFGSFGAGPVPAPSPAEWLDIFVTLGRVGAFFGGGLLVLLTIMVLARRGVEGRFPPWAEVRLFATVMAVKVALMVFAMGMIIIVSLIAALVTGGWQGSWHTALVGAAVGAALGLPLGLGVAWLKIPQRLGLDKPGAPGGPQK
jgi:hypothetical protein